MSKEQKKDQRFLSVIEKIGNKLPDPAFLFVLLALITIAASALAAQFDLSVTYEGFNAETGEIESITTAVNNLLSVDGIHYMVTNIISNFTSFFPLGPVFTIVLGVSVMEGTGMLSVLLRRIVSKTPKAFISAMVVFLGIMSNIASSTGYIVLVPLGAIIFWPVNVTRLPAWPLLTLGSQEDGLPTCCLGQTIHSTPVFQLRRPIF